MKNEQVIRAQSARFDSFYLYDEAIIQARIAGLRQSFPAAQFLYSVKANPAPALLRRIFAAGLGADAASLGEVQLAHRMGLAPDRIYYSAPAKTPADLAGALDDCVLIADSPREIELIQQLAAARGAVASIGVRLNPDFTFAGDGGAASKFGIDEGEAFALLAHWKTLANVRIVGLHVHSRSQELDAGVLGRYYERMFDLAARFAAANGAPLAFVNMGSGIGIPYAPGDRPVDTAALGARESALAAQFAARLPGTRVLIETGRHVVGESGVYVTRVLDRKQSHGRTFLLLANTLNGFARPSLARLVLHYAPDAAPAASEPLFTCADAFRIETLPADGAAETVTLTGNLCTATDVVAENIVLPHLEPGGLVVLTNAGSYAAVLSPMQFAALTPPAQLLLCADGSVADACV